MSKQRRVRPGFVIALIAVFLVATAQYYGGGVPLHTHQGVDQGGTLDAAALSTGTLAAARGGAGTITGALKANGAGLVSQAACADLSNAAASCATDATNASNLSTGTLAAARGGAGTIAGALKGNGFGLVSQAACADLSNAAASCATDATNASNISTGTLAAARLAPGSALNNIGAAGITQTYLAPASVGNGQLKLAIGSATLSGTGMVTLNRYAFWPNTFSSTGAAYSISTAAQTDSGDTLGRFEISGPAAPATVTARWDYITATDQPIIWLVFDSTNSMRGVWSSDDQLTNNAPPIASAGLTSVSVMPSNINVAAAPAAAVSAAKAWIAAKGYSLTNLNYRILEQWAGQLAPSAWILTHCTYQAPTLTCS